MKARNATLLDIRTQSDFSDYMVVATGTSSRHVAAIVENVVVTMKHEKQPILGVEGDNRNHWVLIDLGEIIVNVMQAEAREFYALEQLWSEEEDDHEASTTALT